MADEVIVVEEPKTGGAPAPDVKSTLKQETIETHRIKPLFRASQIVWYIVGLIEILLMFRFFLKLFGANPAAGFTKFIYGATMLFAAPFYSVFGIDQAGGAILEWSTLLAMLVYLMLGWLIVKAFVMSKPVTTKEANTKLPTQDAM